MTPNPEKVNFFRKHKEEIGVLINKENIRRERRSAAPLSEEEIDQAMGEMMQLVENGERLRSYKFPEIVIEPTQHDRIEQPIAQRSPHANKSHAKNSFQFEAVICANGFLLNFTKNGDNKSFIFKNEKELMSIFRDTLFFELKKGKEQAIDKEPDIQ